MFQNLKELQKGRNKIKPGPWLLFCFVALSCKKGVVLQPVATAPTDLVITASSTKPYSIYIQLQYPGQTVDLDNQQNLIAPYKNSCDVHAGDAVGIKMQSSGTFTYTFTYKDSVIVSGTIDGSVTPTIAVAYKIP